MTETDVTAISNSLEPLAGPGAASDCATPHQHTGRGDEAKLRDAGLRPTRRRAAPALHREATRSDLQISLATTYNALNQFLAVLGPPGSFSGRRVME